MKYNPNVTMPDVSVKAIDPALPPTEIYAPQDLQKCKIWSREEFTKRFPPHQLPPFDETWRPRMTGLDLPLGPIAKGWIDTAPYENGFALGDMVEYRYFDPVTRDFKTFSISVADAAYANQIGFYRFPLFEPILTTPAEIDVPVLGRYPAPAADLSSREHADRLQADLNAFDRAEGGPGDGQVSLGTWPGGATFIANGETRNNWDVDFRHHTFNAAHLLVERWGPDGIGSTRGRWFSDGVRIEWHMDTRDQYDYSAVVPVPVRSLLPNERVKPSLMSVYIVRNGAAVIEAEQGGGFTQSDREMLRAIHARIGNLDFLGTLKR